MKLIQIIQLIFSTIGVIWVAIQIKNHFTKQQKSKIGVSYSIYPAITGKVYKPNFELNQYVDKSEIKIKRTCLNISNQTMQKEEDPKELFVEEIEFKNIGKKIISGADFFNNDQLGLRNSTDILNISITKETPAYINTDIEITKERINIKFDKIKPNDSIFICVLRTNNFLGNCYNYFLGQTDDIDQFYPLNIRTYKDTSLSCNRWYEEVLLLKTAWQYFKESISWSILSLLAYFFILSVIAKVILYYVK